MERDERETKRKMERTKRGEESKNEENRKIGRNERRMAGSEEKLAKRRFDKRQKGRNFRMVEMARPDLKKRVTRKNWFTSEDFLNQYGYDGNDLGAVWQKDKTIFKVWAPTAESVFLKLYAFGSKGEIRKGEAVKEPTEIFSMEQGENGTWSVQVDGNLEGFYYTYLVTVDGETCETGDPYARACGVNGVRSMVVDLAHTNPENWEQDRRPEGIRSHPVIYELHIKDFSNDFHSGVRAEWRGKYLAFTEEGTSLDGNGEFPSGMEYLKQLGVTYVHLLPSFDFGSVEEQVPNSEQFNWGYDPVNYNVPEGSYATDAFDGHIRILEFKKMVMALHQAGIGVILDVVFNHTYDLDGVFQRMVPDYYYRVDQEGNYTNGSACGNDTASERVMFRRFMADSVCYWVTEYHIDGFRFDLMGLHDTVTMNEIRKRLNRLPNGNEILMYGEPWAADRTAMEAGSVPAIAKNVHYLDTGIAIFSDIVRDSVKGNNFIAAHKGYVNGGKQEILKAKENVMASVCGLCGAEYTGEVRPLAPAQIMNYVSAHDDRTLWDKLVVSVKEEAKYDQKYEDILQMNKMAAGIVFTCLGTPFFQAGEEFARTKNGCENSYNCSPKLNQLDWSRAKEYQELVAYYRFLIAVRRELPVLERQDAEAVKLVSFLDLDEDLIGLIGFVLEDPAVTGKWKKALVYYNPYHCKQQISLPDGKWKILTDGVKDWSLDGMEIEEKILQLQARSVTILGMKEFNGK